MKKVVDTKKSKVAVKEAAKVALDKGKITQGLYFKVLALNVKANLADVAALITSGKIAVHRYETRKRAGHYIGSNLLMARSTVEAGNFIKKNLVFA